MLHSELTAKDVFNIAISLTTIVLLSAMLGAYVVIHMDNVQRSRDMAKSTAALEHSTSELRKSCEELHGAKSLVK